jgi:signal transduction histidine kinase
MPTPETFGHAIVRSLDPRRSLAAGAMWLIIGLAAAFSTAAAVWVGRIARANVSEQHIRRLSLETDQLASDLGQAVAGRLDAIRAASHILQTTMPPERRGGLREVFGELTLAYPQFDWIAVADPHGIVLSASDPRLTGSDVQSRDWFTAGTRGPWLGVIESAPSAPAGTGAGRSAAHVDNATLGDIAAPVRDEAGQVVGVIAAHLTWRRSPYHPERLTDESDPATQAYVLDRNGTVLIGPDELRNKPWNGVPEEVDSDPRRGRGEAISAPQFQRLPDRRRVLVSRALLTAAPDEAAEAGWQVQLTEPIDRVFQRARAVTYQILWVSMCLGAATALLGVLGARKLTGRLQRLAASVASVGQNESENLEIPPGADEVARLARAFARILSDLRAERVELQTLGNELERRVIVRTREVERLAEEARYAAIVRERLKIARDLHDTLAHSMMALLSEVRFLRRLHAHDPGAVAEELVRAEELARTGLQEARSAISQMRVNAVRDTGLGPALAREFDRFVDRTGVAGEFSADAESARFGDERAETLLRMAQEALRNVERHSMATRVSVKLETSAAQLELRIEDNGVGFDPHTPCPEHYGIVGLREQAELIGAELCIDTAPQLGTKIRVRLRVAPAAFAA